LGFISLKRKKENYKMRRYSPKALSLSVLCVALLIQGCASTFAPSVDFPDEVKSSSVEIEEESSGLSKERKPPKNNQESAQYSRLSGFQEGASEGSLFNPVSFANQFQDRRARQVGDVLIVDIVENIDSRQQNTTAVKKNDEFAINTPQIRGVFGLRALDANASSSKDFKGEGSTAASNQITGTVSVIVTEVLPSGNLRVKGEKQIGTNREVEAVRFYGIVNPNSIRGGNRVPSNEVAEARIEYRGKGAIDSVQTMGWLSRFFLTISPF
jgi:flagellar L-ring protein FlgH